VRLGLSAVAANELIHNAVIDAYSFRRITITEDYHDIHRENQGFISQQYIDALHFWI